MENAKCKTRNLLKSTRSKVSNDWYLQSPVKEFIDTHILCLFSEMEKNRSIHTVNFTVIKKTQTNPLLIYIQLFSIRQSSIATQQIKI